MGYIINECWNSHSSFSQTVTLQKSKMLIARYKSGLRQRQSGKVRELMHETYCLVATKSIHFMCFLLWVESVERVLAS